MNKNLTKSINIFCHSLIENGVPGEKVRSALSYVIPPIVDASKAINSGTEVDIELKVEDIFLEVYTYRRNDFLGRAMLRNFEQKLPKDNKEDSFIRRTPIPETVPREVFHGIIQAVKIGHGYNEVEEYEKLCSQKAKKYIASRSGDIDINGFVGDPEVKTIVTDMIKKMKTVLKNIEGEVQKQWFLSVIKESTGFQKMEREITDEEYRIIIEQLYKLS